MQPRTTAVIENGDRALVYGDWSLAAAPTLTENQSI